MKYVAMFTLALYLSIVTYGEDKAGYFFFVLPLSEASATEIGNKSLSEYQALLYKKAVVTGHFTIPCDTTVKIGQYFISICTSFMGGLGITIKGLAKEPVEIGGIRNYGELNKGPVVLKGLRPVKQEYIGVLIKKENN